VSVAPSDQNTEGRRLTLGELLYADPGVTLVSEKQWLAVVRAIGTGDEAALRLLYEKAFPVVSIYLLRITGDRRVADALLVDVFQMVWCEAPVFDTADGPVLGWIMRQARALALAHVQSFKQSSHQASQRQSSNDSGQQPSGGGAAGAPTDPVPMGERGNGAAPDAAFQQALDALTEEERQAIEATFLDGSSYAEFAVRSGQPVGTVKSRIRSGLAKLQAAMLARGEKR
jgi:RNA polymerase sigma-70 factor (ECF subfamily)